MSKKAYITERYKTKEAWLSRRGIGGTDVAAIVDLSPWKTKLEVYNRLVNKTGIGKDDDNASKAFGRSAEPLLRKLWALNHPDMKMRGPRGIEMYRSTTMPLLTATVDGIVTDKDGRKGIWECKTHEIRGADDLAEWTGKWPVHYLIQVMTYLLVRNDCDYVELCGALNFHDFSDEGKRLVKTEIRYEHIEREDVLNELLWLEGEIAKFAESVKNKLPPDGEIQF